MALMALMLSLVGMAASPAVAATAVTAIGIRDVDGVGRGTLSAIAGVDPTPTIEVTDGAAGAVVFSVPGAGLTMTLTPGSGSFTVGTLPVGSAASQVAVTLDQSTGQGSFTSGTVNVIDVQRDGAGALTSAAFDLDGTFAQTGWTPGRFVVRLRFASAEPWVGLYTSTAGVDFGGTFLGNPDASTVTLTVLGSSPVTFGSAHVTVAPPGATPDPGPFGLGVDGCRGRTLTTGQSCSVGVTVRTFTEGVTEGHVVVPDDSLAGRTSVRLSVNGLRSDRGRIRTVTPTRLVDTRSTKNPLRPGEDRRIHVAGRAGIPSGEVMFAVLTVTAVRPSSSGYLTVHPEPQPPAVSQLNFRAGEVRANTIFVPISTTGDILVHNPRGTTPLLIDVVGYVDGRVGPSTPSGIIETMAPFRAFDSRSTDPMIPDQAVTVDVDFGTEANAATTALLVNLTAIRSTAGGYLTAWNGVGAPPGVSSVNFGAGTVVPNFALVPTSHASDGWVRFAVNHSSAGTTDLAVDVVGAIDARGGPGLLVHPIAGERVVDTRSGVGTTKAPLASGSTRIVTPRDFAVPDVVGLIGTVTAVRPTAGTWLTMWDRTSATLPGTSVLNPVTGDLVSNTSLTTYAPNKTFGLYNAAGSTDALVDVQALLRAPPGLGLDDTAADARAGHGARATTGSHGWGRSVAGVRVDLH